MSAFDLVGITANHGLFVIDPATVVEKVCPHRHSAYQRPNRIQPFLLVGNSAHMGISRYPHRTARAIRGWRISDRVVRSATGTAATRAARGSHRPGKASGIRDTVIFYPVQSIFRIAALATGRMHAFVSIAL